MSGPSPYGCARFDDRDRFVIGIDVGCSATSPTTGIATAPLSDGNRIEERCTVGGAIGLLSEILRGAGPPVLLIFEAPLSRSYDVRTGNPAYRGKFEKGRPWWLNAGAATLIAAQHLLQSIDFRSVGRDIVLAEALVSYKPARTDHVEDARRIVRDAWAAQWALPERTWTPISPLQSAAPPIILYSQHPDSLDARPPT